MPALLSGAPRATARPGLAATVPPAETSAPARNPSWAVLVNKDMNLHRVTPTFYRGEQFKKTEVPELQKLDIRAIVNLRNNHSDAAELAGSGIKEIRVRINTWNIADRHIIAALAAIRRAEAAGPVLLHCQHGADRTGLVSAMYRIVFQNWSRDAALDELINGGYGYHSVWTNIPRYLNNVDIEKIRQAVLAALATGEPSPAGHPRSASTRPPRAHAGGASFFS
ncbi:MAG: tyrosine-protein phosphatase [Opitutaceae bacterium]|nr:tyrosine-protein phosphatase [Opitutaceae bacterium]